MSDEIDAEWVPHLAVLSPFAARWLLNRLAAMEGRGARTFRGGIEWAVAQQRPDLARELHQAHTQLLASAQDYDEHRISVDGSTEEPSTEISTDSNPIPPGWINTALVAKKLRVSPRTVTNMCNAKVLTATKVGHPWWIDPDSVTDLQQLRSSR